MKIELIDKPSKMGYPKTWVVTLYCPPDMDMCPRCKKKFLKGDRVFIPSNVITPDIDDQHDDQHPDVENLMLSQVRTVLKNKIYHFYCKRTDSGRVAYIYKILKKKLPEENEETPGKVLGG